MKKQRKGKFSHEQMAGLNAESARASSTYNPRVRILAQAKIYNIIEKIEINRIPDS
jgi:hypothetical protein